MTTLSLAQVQAAMNAMLQKAMEQPHRPVAMAIVDAAGILLAYQQMDGLRLFTRRHAVRKAYTAAITGMNSGAFGEDCVKVRGHTVREIGGDLELTPGAGGMFCGGCLRDNALVAALRQTGHHALMVPLYLPLTLDEPDQSTGTPVFYSGINVFLEQKSSLFRKLPAWMLKPFASRLALRWASGRAATTRASEAGELTLSMLRGEAGHQARELDALIAWLKTQPKPDVICLSNALLAGMARQLKSELKAPVTCLLTGEDTFLDALPEGLRNEAWRTLSERCRDVDLFLPPSRYFGDLMQRRLALRSEQVRVVPSGIPLAGFEVRKNPPQPPVLGYFARMCREKGLDTQVEAYLLLKRRDSARELR